MYVPAAVMVIESAVAASVPVVPTVPVAWV